MTEKEEKLENLREAINDLEGVMIPFNISKDYIRPLKKWLDKELENHLEEKED